MSERFLQADAAALVALVYAGDEIGMNEFMRQKGLKGNLVAALTALESLARFAGDLLAAGCLDEDGNEVPGAVLAFLNDYQMRNATEPGEPD